MASHGWLFDQVIFRVGGTDALLHLIDPNIVKEIASGKSINDLPIALLAQVLSYVERKSVFYMMQVCKLWHRAICEQNHFWKRHIDNALDFVIADKKITNKQEQCAIRMFSTFYSPVPETLRDQVEWVFKVHLTVQKWTNIHKQICDSKQRMYLVFERTTWTNRNVANWICLDIMKCVRATWYIGARFNDMEGRYVNRILCFDIPNRNYCAFMDIPKYNELGIGTYIYVQMGATFEGSVAYFHGSGYMAHGDGKWTFDNGVVLEGAGVAHMGEPRFIMDDADVREWKKRRVVVPGPSGAGDEE